MGTGPFKFAEWLRSPRLEILGVRLERNPAYYGRKPYLSAIEYSPYFTDEQFEDGSVHLVSVTSERMLRKRFPILENNTLKSYFLAFSCDVPPLDRPEVRKALALGLDKTRLAEACDTPATLHQVLNNYIPPLLPGFFPKAAGPFTDPDTAKLLLDRLLPEGGRKALTLTLLCDAPRTDESSGFARELERELGALEIKLDVKYLRRPEDARDVRAPYVKFLAYTMDFPDPENIIVPLYQSGSVVERAQLPLRQSAAGRPARAVRGRDELGAADGPVPGDRKDPLRGRAGRPAVLGKDPHRRPPPGPGPAAPGHGIHLPRRQGHLAGGLRRP